MYYALNSVIQDRMKTWMERQTATIQIVIAAHYAHAPLLPSIPVNPINVIVNLEKPLVGL